MDPPIDFNFVTVKTQCERQGCSNIVDRNNDKIAQSLQEDQ